MLIYQIIGILVCIPLFASNIKNKVKLNKRVSLSFQDICIILLIFLLFIISSIRYNIGTDYSIYQDRFSKIEFSSTEWLNISLIWLLQSLGGSFHVYLVITNVIVFIILTFSIVSFVPDKNKAWCLIIYVLFNFYGASFNYIRQFPALMLVCVSIYFLAKANRKNKKYFAYSLIYFLLAIGFHTSCLFALPFYLIAKLGVINKKTVLAFTVIFTVLYVINPINFINQATLFIMNNLTGRWASGTINTTDASWAARLYNSGAALVDRVFYFPFIILLTQMFRDDKYKMTPVSRLILSIFYLYNLLIALNIGSEMIDRVLLYMSIFCIFAIPYMFSYVRQRYGQIPSAIFKIFIFSVGVFVLLRELNGNVHEIVPYITIFGK